MNQNLKNFVCFLTGAAAGGVSTWLAVKKYYELKADLEVESVKEAYNRKVEKFEPVKSSVDGEIEGPDEIDEDIKQGRTKSSIVKELNNKPPLTDYTKFFKEKGNEKTLDLKETLRDAKSDAESEEDAVYGEDIDPAELESPEDDKPYTDEEDANEQIAFDDHQLNGAHKDAGPACAIDISDFELTCANYDKLTLHYYQPDDLLTNEEGEIIGWSDLIGEELAPVIDDTDFDSNSEDHLYIRSDKLMCDFEVQKIFDGFGGNEE